VLYYPLVLTVGWSVDGIEPAELEGKA